MIKIEITCATADDALSVISKLAGVDVAVSGSDEAAPAAKAKKETPSAKAKAATTAAFEEPKGRGRGKAAKVPTADELKAHILKVAGDDQPDRIKEYVGSYGVKKISDMDDAQRKDAFDGAEAFFAGEEDGEEDPMA